MAAYTRPDVYVSESLRSVLRSTARPADPVGVFAGESWRGPETPTLVRSWSEFVARFGGFRSTTRTLHHAVHSYFLNGGGPCYVLRVTDGSAVPATTNVPDRNEDPDSALTVTANSAGAWGNGLSVQVFDRGPSGRFDLYVYDGSVVDANIAERFTDLSADPGDARYYETVINGLNRGSKLITVADGGSESEPPENSPEAGTYALTGGDDGSPAEPTHFTAAVDRLDAVQTGMVVNFPGIVDTDTINALVAFCEGRGDSFAVLDTALTDSPDTAIAFASSVTPSSSFAAVYWPWLHVTDPSVNRVGVTRAIPPGGAVVGTIIRTDATRGPHKTPAGNDAVLRGVVGLAEDATLDELGQLNQASVNAVRVFTDRGAVIMGGRTLKTSGGPDRYISARRSLIFVRQNLTEIMRNGLFEPNDDTLWEVISNEMTQFLSTFWQRGGLKGGGPAEAFFVKCDADNNTPSTIEEGELHAEVGVALQYPAEFMVLKIGQYDNGAITSVAEEV